MSEAKKIPPVLPDGDYLVGVVELADFMGLTATNVSLMIKRGEVPLYKVGGRYFFDKSEIRDSVRREVLKCFK